MLLSTLFWHFVPSERLVGRKRYSQLYLRSEGVQVICHVPFGEGGVDILPHPAFLRNAGKCFLFGCYPPNVPKAHHNLRLFCYRHCFGILFLRNNWWVERDAANYTFHRKVWCWYAMYDLVWGGVPICQHQMFLQTVMDHFLCMLPTKCA